MVSSAPLPDAAGAFSRLNVPASSSCARSVLPPRTRHLYNGNFMAEVPQPGSDPKETDKKMRERVDKLVGQAASESGGSITLGGQASDFTAHRALRAVGGAGRRRAV